MKTNVLVSLGSVAAVALLAGCSSTPPNPNVERGPHGTIAYDVLIEASAPGARIEANGEMLGATPLHLKIFGDKDGTFHDFGSYYYVIKAYPMATNQYPQVKYFGTGRHGAQEDHVPQHVYFDLSQPQANPNPPVIYEQPRVYYGAPYPYPYPYPYGPGVGIYVGPRRRW
jgi:hypothetical protein